MATPLLLVLPLVTAAQAQAVSPPKAPPAARSPATPVKRVSQPKAPPAAKKRAVPKKRPVAKKRAVPKKRPVTRALAAPSKRAAAPRKPPLPLKPKKATKAKKAKKASSKPPLLKFYIGADLSFFPGAQTSREIYGIGAETMPNTAAIRQLHGTSLRFIQGLSLMNRVLDVRFGVGLSNLIPVGGRRALWGSDFGLGAGVRLHRFGRVDLQIFNAYRLLVVTGLDRHENGIGLQMEVGLGAAYQIDKRHWVEFRLGYGHRQLRYNTDTTEQVGGLTTPAGVVFKSHMIMLSFALLHFR